MQEKERDKRFEIVRIFTDPVTGDSKFGKLVIPMSLSGKLLPARGHLVCLAKSNSKHSVSGQSCSFMFG